MEHYDVDQLVVTVTPTIMDGPVVRWFRSLNSAEHGMPIVSASRNGVMGHGGFIDPALFDRAWVASVAITERHDMEHLATHRRPGVFSGLLLPVERDTPAAAETLPEEADRG